MPLSSWFWVSLLIAIAGCSGCAATHSHDQQLLQEIQASDLPRELDMATVPAYRVAPGDVLLLHAVNNIRSEHDPLRAGDELLIRASHTSPVEPAETTVLTDFKVINQVYQVQPDGTVDLGPEYGSAPVEGMTVDQAQHAVEAHLKDAIGLTEPKVAVSLHDLHGRQEISGEYLIHSDGTVSLGIYGSAYVAGMSVEEIQLAIEVQLQSFIHEPEIQVDVAAHNSQKYYVIIEGGGHGETVLPIPFTGNETVLDAITHIQGLSEVSAKAIWVSRPAPNGSDIAQKLPVDWRAITEDGVTTTNYQLLPGDRVYVRAYKPAARMFYSRR